MTDLLPVTFQWTGEEMTPIPRQVALCNRQFVVGQYYMLVEEAPPSDASRRHYFAVVRSAFENLPERHAARFPSADHLRKWCLIQAGFCEKKEQPFRSPKEARESAMTARWLDTYVVIKVIGSTICVWKAISQKERVTRDKAEFQRQKQAVFDQLSKLLDVDVTTLAKNPVEGS